MTRTGCFSNASARIIRQAASKHCACRGDGVETTPPPAGRRRRDAFIHASTILDASSAPAYRRQSFESGAGVRAAGPRRRANILRRVGDDPVGDPRPRRRRPRGTPGAQTAGGTGPAAEQPCCPRRRARPRFARARRPPCEQCLKGPAPDKCAPAGAGALAAGMPRWQLAACKTLAY